MQPLLHASCGTCVGWPSVMELETEASFLSTIAAVPSVIGVCVGRKEMEVRPRAKRGAVPEGGGDAAGPTSWGGARYPSFFVRAAATMIHARLIDASPWD